MARMGVNDGVKRLQNECNIELLRAVLYYSYSHSHSYSTIIITVIVSLSYSYFQRAELFVHAGGSS